MSRPLTNSEIEAQVRAAYGLKLDRCEQLHLLVENALHSWAGRAIAPESVAPIILAEGSPATKAYGGADRFTGPVTPDQPHSRRTT